MSKARGRWLPNRHFTRRAGPGPREHGYLVRWMAWPWPRLLQWPWRTYRTG